MGHLLQLPLRLAGPRLQTSSRAAHDIAENCGDVFDDSLRLSGKEGLAAGEHSADDVEDALEEASAGGGGLWGNALGVILFKIGFLLSG